MAAAAGVRTLFCLYGAFKGQSGPFAGGCNRGLEQLYEKRDIINSTPGLVPVKGGWVSSHFGYRTYPFTGEVALHEGIDIAAAYGSPVYAPAQGVVIFAGYKPGYGKVIILDHGYDLLTLYGHLSDIMVTPHQKFSGRM